MEKPSKLNERLTLIANIAVVLGIVFLALELRQNTQAIQAQTRDSITDKQMEFSGWIGTSSEVADVHDRGKNDIESLDRIENEMFGLLVGGIFREWENSHYQYRRGLFTREEFEPRFVRWQQAMEGFPGYRAVWDRQREGFAPDFRAEIDAIVAEIEGQ